MAQKPIKGSTAKPGNGGREDRLKAALKANLARRKAQARARTDGEGALTRDEAGKPADE